MITGCAETTETPCEAGSLCASSDPAIQGIGDRGGDTELPWVEPNSNTDTEDSTEKADVSGEDGETGESGGGEEPSPDAGETDAQSLPETETECGNGNDDDADGFVDCKDGDCAGDPLCVETLCGDGLDNDEDGETDCEDFDCFTNPVCEVETCQSFYHCLAEEGCGCTMGTTCPEAGTDAFESCQATCFSDESGDCPNTCISKLEPATQINLAEFQTCTKSNCSASIDDEAYYECVLSDCLEEYSSCFYTGTLDCGEFYYECANDCGDDEACITLCKDAMSGQGYADAVTWDTCRNDLCDLDGDGVMDSDSCYYLASFFACSDEAGTCIPAHLTKDQGTCADITDCLLSCVTFEESSCVLNCLELVGESNEDEVSGLVSCMVNACGSSPDSLTPQCAAGALANSCQNEWALCSQ